MINHGANVLMSLGNEETVAASLSKYEFIFSVDLFMTETAQFADIVLPDCDNLESFDSRSNYPFIFSLPGGPGRLVLADPASGRGTARRAAPAWRRLCRTGAPRRVSRGLQHGGQCHSAPRGAVPP